MDREQATKVLIEKAKNVIIINLISKGQHIFEFNNNQNKLIIEFNEASYCESISTRYLTITYSRFDIDGYTPIGVQSYAAYEIEQAVDTFIERLRSIHPEKILGICESLDGILLRTIDVPKIYYQSEDGEQVTVKHKDLLKSFLTHDSVKYLYKNNSSLEMIKCKAADDDSISYSKINVIYSDYDEPTNSNTESFSIENIVFVFDIFMARLTSSDPSMKALINGKLINSWI